MNQPYSSLSDTSNHPWVQDYLNFEAVLVCENTLQDWESDSILRAFQTFQFRDISEEEDSVEVIHNESGGIIQYEGNVVAIRFSDNFVETLPDMVLALYALGWRNAIAYHSHESIALFMHDLGKSIPANLDFDVTQSGIMRTGLDIPNGNVLIQNLAMEGISASAQLEMIRNGLASLEEDTTLRKPAGPISVNNEFLKGLDDEIRISPDIFKSQKFGIIDSDIPVPEMGDVFELAFEAPAESERTKSRKNPLVNPAHELLNKQIFKIGAGYLCFDLLQSPLNIGILRDLGENFADPSKYVHIFPSHRSHSAKWDFLGEIPANYPEFALTLASTFLTDKGDIKLLAGVMLHVLKTQIHATLRHLFDIVLKLNNSVTAKDDLKIDSISSTLESMLRFGNFSKVADVMLTQFGDMGLIPDGDCLIDCTAGTQEACFSVFRLKSADHPWIYIVHESLNDLDFAKNLVDCLYKLADYHSRH